MKLVLLSAVVAVAVLGLTADAGTLESRLFRRSAPGTVSEQQQWQDFKSTHKKSYPEPEEDARRFALFRANLATINEHNEKFKRGEVTWKMAINHSADLTKKEASRRNGFSPRE